MSTFEKAPRWVAVVIFILALPVFQMLSLLSGVSAALQFVRVLLWTYPFYIIVAAYLAYVCYRTRPLVSWILMVLMLLTHLAMWHLVYSDLEM